MPAQAIIGDRTIVLNDSERQPCEVWTRIMGYYRPIDNANIGKRQEHRDRVYFRTDKII
jgi:anaerobic ribonucleoside-triphosphate reductase